MELRRRQTILSGRVLVAFFVQGEVQFALAALDLPQSLTNCRSWKNELILFAGLRRRPRGGLGSEFWAVP